MEEFILAMVEPILLAIMDGISEHIPTCGINTKYKWLNVIIEFVISTFLVVLVAAILAIIVGVIAGGLIALYKAVKGLLLH